MNSKDEIIQLSYYVSLLVKQGWILHIGNEWSHPEGKLCKIRNRHDYDDFVESDLWSFDDAIIEILPG